MLNENAECMAFLRAIADSPDDDTPRLVLADWMEEHGQSERAEFVRCQIELASNYPGHDFFPDTASESWHQESDPKCPACAMLRRSQKLLRLCGEDMARPIAAAVGIPESAKFAEDGVGWACLTYPLGEPDALKIDLDWRRGFLSKLSLSWRDCSAHLDSILASPWVPGLDEVELTSLPPATGAYTRTFLVRSDSYESALSHPEIPRLQSCDDRGFIVSRISTSINPVEGQKVWEVEVEYDVPSLASLESRWPKSLVRKWTLPPEPRAEPPANYNYASAYAANAAWRGR